MQFLGHLVWWRVGNPAVRGGDVGPMLAELGIAQIPPPKPIVPADAFRRLTGSSRREYDLEDGRSVTLDLHPASGQKTMLVRHVVRTVRVLGIVQSAERVGDCAFYRPPKGQPSRARMRVTVFPEGLPDRAEVEAFARELRAEYEKALNYLDPQAMRRLVRQYLASVSALYLQGPYFVPQPTDAERLAELLRRLGGGSTCLTMPVPDVEQARLMLTEGLTALFAANEGTATFIEPYVPLGVVPEAVWQQLEGAGDAASED